MSETTTREKTKAETAVPPWGIEIDHPRNCDVLMQAVPGCRLRSAIEATKGHTDKNGDPHVPVDQSQTLASLPRVPGMRLIVKPAEQAYVIIDPLEDDEALCDRIGKWIRTNTPFRTGNKLKGVPRRQGKLDQHRMKTLVREMATLVSLGQAKVVNGQCPARASIDALPGRYLLNPGARVQNTQPVYEDQYEAWLDKQRGGDSGRD